MLKRDYPTQYCAVASTLEVIGERWTILIVRDIFLGVRRFDDLQRSLGVARNILQSRLERLVEEGIVVKRPYQERPVRYEYRLTAKGADLWPVLVSLVHWGNEYALEGEPPIVIQHKGCGGELDDRRTGARRPEEAGVAEAGALEESLSA
jgi:DNA-binding HxlR family transcriptional regulator